MSMFFDLIVIAVAVVFLCFGFKKGFFKSIMDLIVMILSVFIPYLFAPCLAEQYYNNFIYNDLIGKINEILNQNISPINSAKSIFGFYDDKLPDFFSNNSFMNNVTVNDILSALNGSVNKDLAVADLLKPPIVKLTTVIMFAVLTIVTVIILKLLLKFVLKLPRIPLFGLIDSILGLCMGALKFVVFAFIFVVVFKSALLIAPQNSTVRDVNDAIDSSQIFKSVYKLNTDVLNDYLKLH